MSTRWNPTLPPSHDPEPRVPVWKKYLLPAAGAGAILLVVAIVAVTIAAGGGDQDDDDEDEIALAIDDDDEDADDNVELTPTATATPELTPTPDLTAESELVPLTPTPEPTEEAESTPTPEPTPPSEPVAEEPEPEPTPVPEQPAPESPPAVGDFGELPPGDMPSGSPAEALSLQYNLDMSLGAIPSQAAVYQVQHRQWSLSDAQGVASRLGIDAEVVDQGGGSFRAEGSNASIYINPGSIQYVRSGGLDTPPGLPGNDQLVQMARSWLNDSGLAGIGVGSGRVLDRDEGSGRAYVQLKPSEPAEIISHTPSAGVSIRGDGVVVEAQINLPSALAASTYGLRSPENLWADAAQGRGYVQINVNDLPQGFQGATGTVSITSAGIAYTVAGSPQGSQYLVPVVVFSGAASIEGASGAVPVRIYVQGPAAQAVPRG